MWECVSRKYTVLSDGFWSYPITKTGIYSLVLNPDKVIDPVGPSGGDGEDGFFMANLLWFIIGGSILLLLIVALLIYCLCCRNKPLTGAHVLSDV